MPPREWSAPPQRRLRQIVFDNRPDSSQNYLGRSREIYLDFLRTYYVSKALRSARCEKAPLRSTSSSPVANRAVRAPAARIYASDKTMVFGLTIVRAVRLEAKRTLVSRLSRGTSACVPRSVAEISGRVVESPCHGGFDFGQQRSRDS